MALVLACGGGSVQQAVSPPDYELKFENGVDPLRLTANIEYRLFTVKKSTGNPRNGARFKAIPDHGSAGGISMRSSDGTGEEEGQVFITCTAPLTGRAWAEVDGAAFGETFIAAQAPPEK